MSKTLISLGMVRVAGLEPEFQADDVEFTANEARPCMWQFLHETQ